MSEPNQVVAVAADGDAEGRSKAERAFVARLDVFLLTFGCISQVIKFTTYFNVAYCIMLVPSQVIMTHVRPSWWLPSVEIAWGLVTGLVATTSRAGQVYVLRAMLGLCESAAYPGMMTLFMSWYTPTEMAKRIGFYHSCQSLGQMLSGALQAAVVESLAGKANLSGWRWLFVVNAVITVVWGVAGYCMIPDMPTQPNPWAFWLDETHTELARGRLDRTNRVDTRPISWTGARRIFTGWLVYFFAAFYAAMVLATSGADYLGLFLKSVRRDDGSPRWKTTDVNLIPVAGSAVTVVFVWIWAYMSDWLRSRWVFIIIQALIALMVAITMSVWTAHPQTTPLSAAYAGYFIQRVALGTSPLFWAWLSDLLPTDPQGRTLIVGATIAVYYSISAWSQVLLWPTSQAPYYKVGWQSAAALCALVIVLCLILHAIEARLLAPRRALRVEIAVLVADGDEVDPDISAPRVNPDVSAPAAKPRAESNVSRVQSSARVD